MNSATKTRKDMITVGFYENKKKDLYTIYIPDQKIPLYYSPLPNDEGKLTLWWLYWLIRNPNTIYGIGLYELIKNNKVMYDRLKNMTIDQLVMAIYPMLFYSGTPKAGEGKITLSPNTIEQKLPGSTVEQIKIQFDPRGWDGVTQVKEDMDEITGITPTLQGDVTGKTLGEILHAKDAALKRLNIPMLNISKAIEMDAYLTLSWANQIYSIPEIKTFLTQEEMDAYQKENGVVANKVTQLPAGENGESTGMEAQFNPKLDLGLDEDKDGFLIESPNRRFLQLGDGEGQLPLGSLKWEGKIQIKAMSIISPNPEIERQRKLELYNVISPVVYQMSSLMYQHVDPKTGAIYTPEGGVDVAISLYAPAKQILEIQDEKPENWLPKQIIEMAENPDALAQYKQEMAAKEQQAKMAQEQAANAAAPLMVDANAPAGSPSTGGTPPGGQAGAPGGGSVVAPSSIASPIKTMLASNQGANSKALKSMK
jgi:hypothetical protein